MKRKQDEINDGLDNKGNIEKKRIKIPEVLVFHNIPIELWFVIMSELKSTHLYHMSIACKAFHGLLNNMKKRKIKQLLSEYSGKLKTAFEVVCPGFCKTLKDNGIMLVGRSVLLDPNDKLFYRIQGAFSPQLTFFEFKEMKEYNDSLKKDQGIKESHIIKQKLSQAGLILSSKTPRYEIVYRLEHDGDNDHVHFQRREFTYRYLADIVLTTIYYDEKAPKPDIRNYIDSIKEYSFEKFWFDGESIFSKGNILDNIYFKNTTHCKWYKRTYKKREVTRKYYDYPQPGQVVTRSETVHFWK